MSDPFCDFNYYEGERLVDIAYALVTPAEIYSCTADLVVSTDSDNVNVELR